MPNSCVSSNNQNNVRPIQKMYIDDHARPECRPLVAPACAAHACATAACNCDCVTAASACDDVELRIARRGSCSRTAAAERAVGAPDEVADERGRAVDASDDA